MKHRIRKDDLVSWKAGRKTAIGRITGFEGDSAVVSLRLPGRWGEIRKIPKSILQYEPPVMIGAEELGRFARFEISYAELKQNRPFADADIPEPYQIVPGDLKAAVLNFRKSAADEERFGDEYFWPLWDEFYDGVGLFEAMNGPVEDAFENIPVPNRYTVFSDAFEVLIQKYEYENGDADLDDVVREVQTWEDNRDKPFAEREYTGAQKRDFIAHWDDDRLAGASDDVKAAYRKILDSLCEEDDRYALKKKAYACYGHGNAAYGRNWPESQKCLLRLMEIDPDPQIANTLGYMYYYGRCTDGVPEYDKAFYYFSIGAAGWYYESRYKLSDMFRNGYGVAKNPRAAATIIWELYGEQLKLIRDGEFGSNFADVALRAGDICREGIDCVPDPNKAYYYYLQAQYAIRMRMLAEDNYGDQKVAAGIDRAVSEVLPDTEYVKQKNTVHFNSLFVLLQDGLRRKHDMEMKIRRISDTEARLVFRIVPYENGEAQPKLFVTVPEAHFCGLLEKVSLKAKNIRVFDIPDGTDTVRFDSVTGDSLYLYGRKVASVDADYVFTAPAKCGKTYTFASVEFAPGGKRYDYLCDIPVSIGDMVRVKTEAGETAVKVTSVFEKRESELALPLKRYRKVLSRRETRE